MRHHSTEQNGTEKQEAGACCTQKPKEQKHTHTHTYPNVSLADARAGLSEEAVARRVLRRSQVLAERRQSRLHGAHELLLRAPAAATAAAVGRTGTGERSIRMISDSNSNRFEHS